MNIKKNLKSATLMELLLALGISTLIIGTALVFFVTSNASLLRTEAMVYNEERARVILSRMGSEIRLSNPYRVDIYNNLTASLSGNAIRFQIPVGSYDTDIYLTSSLGIEWGSNSTADNYITYSLVDGKTLKRTESDGTNVINSSVLAANIKSLVFKRESLSSDRITIQAETQSDVLPGLTRTIKSSIKLRN